MIFDRPIVLVPLYDAQGNPQKGPFGPTEMFAFSGFFYIDENGNRHWVEQGFVDLGWPIPKGLLDQEQAMHDSDWANAKNKADYIEADRRFRRSVANAPTIWPIARKPLAWIMWLAIRSFFELREIYHCFCK